ncbi:DUF1835 domain-containing protein [Vibrio nigripulchritudo]|uniref:DUF1835 domain-containing protein n=1 Tax=Vibrio nigripulchritudo TaxID=28173 RepID=UPI0003B1C023|nr:DUF1835 domain-containing protein [Vibrio nigripulchritudo]CCN70240.1 conserved hypothetical protein [Vibrio nigripulchritudo SFn118]
MNPFSLNLTYLKKQAKTRLKAIKAGSNVDLEWLHENHLSQSITQESVKLADVQLAMARELGLSSWNKLKHHVTQLESNRSLSGEPLPSLDSDISTLHVRCGHDIQNTLKESGFSGDFLPYIDPFCVGPLTDNEEYFLTLRAQYVCNNLISEMSELDKSVEQVKEEETKNTEQLQSAKYRRVVIWVEHDNYDQLMLIRVLSLLSYQNLTRIEIIETDKFPGSERFIGLGQLPPEALRTLWETRKELTIEHISSAKKIWLAFCSSTPIQLITIYNDLDESLFPNIKPVIFRHLQELPQTDSKLGLTQSIAIQILKQNNNALGFKALFRQYMKQEPLVYLGDVMFWAVIKPLSFGVEPILTIKRVESNDWQNATIELIDANFESVSTVEEKWIGGIQLTQNDYWSWDHQDLSTLALNSDS